MYSLSPARILHFDCENRPLSYWCDDRPSAEITAIAWSWADKKEVECVLLGDLKMAGLLISFLSAYDQADMVTGHYIRKHDLPLVNGALIENDIPALSAKLSSDTKMDLVKRLDLPASQEALSAYLNIKEPKIQMTQADWRDANRLTKTGLERTKRRVVADVRQHKAMRAELIKRGLLKAPRMWTP